MTTTDTLETQIDSLKQEVAARKSIVDELRLRVELMIARNEEEAKFRRRLAAIVVVIVAFLFGITDLVIIPNAAHKAVVDGVTNQAYQDLQTKIQNDAKNAVSDQALALRKDLRREIGVIAGSKQLAWSAPDGKPRANDEGENGWTFVETKDVRTYRFRVDLPNGKFISPPTTFISAVGAAAKSRWNVVTEPVKGRENNAFDMVVNIYPPYDFEWLQFKWIALSEPELSKN